MDLLLEINYKGFKSSIRGQQRCISVWARGNIFYKVLADVKIYRILGFNTHAEINNIWHYFIIKRYLLKYLL